MSCHVLKGDLRRVLVVFLEELRFRLSYGEDVARTSHEAAATHSSHDEEPNEDDDDEGREVPQEIRKEVVIAFVSDLAFEVALFVLCVEVTLQIVNGTKLHLDAGGFLVLAHSTKDLLLVFGIDGKGEGVVVFVDSYISHISLVHKFLEGGVIDTA